MINTVQGPSHWAIHASVARLAAAGSGRQRLARAGTETGRGQGHGTQQSLQCTEATVHSYSAQLQCTTTVHNATQRAVVL